MTEYLSIQEKIDFINLNIDQVNFSIDYLQKSIINDNLNEFSLIVAQEKISMLINKQEILQNELNRLNRI
jgi:hypothetical protein